MKNLKELMNLTGRRALVTGGAGHIGRAVSEGLVELGGRVAILDQNLDAAKKTVDGLNISRKEAALAFQCDLKDESSTRGAAKKIVQEMGGLEILIHCAAFVGETKLEGWSRPFPEQTVGAWDAALRVNLTAALVLAQECQVPLAQSGHGSIILFSSIYGMVGPDFRIYEGTPMHNPAGYAASKGGLLQLMRYLTTLLAPKIRVNAISPGGVWRDQHPAFREKYVARTPMGRMATEEDLKGAVAYLASDLSAYVTGQNIAVDGGWTAW
ncbi:MAG: 4-formylbenzenesulfonate dehydrogenase TsaC1/TsaC2 [Elusimicrobia bacterium]|nr:4-formylbenzenesulfonate dehydrogenase TsaC1/TsaC2 [Elusimicrobiota bacterium]